MRRGEEKGQEGWTSEGRGEKGREREKERKRGPNSLL